MKMLSAALVLAGAQLALSSFESPSCNQGIEASNGACSCYFGYEGQFCDKPTAPLETCGPLPTVPPLKTEPVGDLVSRSMEGTDFLFQVAVFGRENRAVYDLTLAENPACSYPSLYYNTSFSGPEGCDQLIDAVVPLNTIIECGFATTMTPDQAILSGTLDLHVRDLVGNFQGLEIFRDTISHLGLKLIFPTTVNLTTVGLTVAAQAELEAAVTLQEYSAITKQVSVSIVTSVQYPYRVSTAVLSEFPARLGDLTVSSLQFCEAAENEPCLQDIGITFTLPSGECSFSGVYTITGTLDCFGFSCSSPFNVTFELESGDVCAYEVEVVANVGGSLESHSTPDFTKPAMAFLEGQTVYFRPLIEADVTIQGLALNNLVINVNGTPIVLFDGVPNPDIPGANLQLLAGGGFAFDVSSSEGGIFFGLSGVSTFTVTAVIDITYDVSFDSGGAFKRSIESTSTTLKAEGFVSLGGVNSGAAVGGPMFPLLSVALGAMAWGL